MNPNTQQLLEQAIMETDKKIFNNPNSFEHGTVQLYIKKVEKLQKQLSEARGALKRIVACEDTNDTANRSVEVVIAKQCLADMGDKNDN